jgi:hypothetical protein
MQLNKPLSPRCGERANLAVTDQCVTREKKRGTSFSPSEGEKVGKRVYSGGSEVGPRREDTILI